MLGDWWPIGSIVAWGSNTIPEGWLLANGAELSYTAEGGKYKPLFDVIGTLYGTGSTGGSFKLPDLRDRFIEGASSTHTLGTYVEASLPDHSHTFTGSSVTSGTNGSHSHTRGTMNFTSDKYHSFYGYGNGRNTTTWKGPFKYNYINNSIGGIGATGNGWHCNSWSFSAARCWSGSLSYTGNHSHTFTAKGTIGNASANQAVYGKSSTVQPKALFLNYIIRY